MKRRLLSSCILSFLFLAELFHPAAKQTVQAASTQDEEDIPVETIDLVAGAGSSEPGDLFSLGDILFFTADDEYGRELWKLTAPYTLANAHRVADIQPGDAGSNPSNLTAIGDTLFFKADDGKTGAEIWATDPPYKSAYQVADINPWGTSSPGELTAIGNTLFFKADDGASGSEVWKTSPPYTSASLVSDIWNGNAGSDPKELISIGWTLLFTADDGSGREVWKSEPPYTAASTQMVRDIYPGGGDAEPKELTRVDNKLFFTAFDGEGHELWYSSMPFDSSRTLRANDFDYLFPSDPSSLEAIGEDVLFSANIGVSGYEPRHSEPPYDVTHTYRIEDVYPGFMSSQPQTKGHSSSGTWFFSANDGSHGVELWKADPPYTEAWLVKDITPGPASTNIQNLVALGNTIYFSANDGSDGFELWKSAPPYEAEDTLRVTDFLGFSTIAPSRVTPIGKNLFFSAYDTGSGWELRIIAANISGLPETGFAPGIITHLPVQPDTLKYTSQNGLRLRIPALGLDTDIFGVPEDAGKWDVTWLGSNAGYLEGTAFPTTPGNTVLTGHSYLSNGNPGPFSRLETLKWGDAIEIQAWGQIYTYEVREVRQAAPDDTKVITRHEDLDWVTLITCQGYDEQAKKYANRVVARAVLTAISTP